MLLETRDLKEAKTAAHLVAINRLVAVASLKPCNAI